MTPIKMKIKNGAADKTSFAFKTITVIKILLSKSETDRLPSGLTRTRADQEWICIGDGKHLTTFFGDKLWNDLLVNYEVIE